jgi:hypothetical protein
MTDADDALVRRCHSAVFAQQLLPSTLSKKTFGRDYFLDYLGQLLILLAFEKGRKSVRYRFEECEQTDGSVERNLVQTGSGCEGAGFTILPMWQSHPICSTFFTLPDVGFGERYPPWLNSWSAQRAERIRQGLWQGYAGDFARPIQPRNARTRVLVCSS